MLNTSPEMSSELIVGLKVSPVMVKGQQVVRSSVVIQEETEKGHTIKSHSRRSDADAFTDILGSDGVLPHHSREYQ